MQDHDQADQNEDRLYIAVRADLPPGLQAAQAAHAAFQFFHAYPVVTGRWFVLSNYLIIVAVPDETALGALRIKAAGFRIEHVAVSEPDLDGQYTALALAPTEATRKLCASLPLALRERVKT